jgi:hypothetical protein
LAWSTDEADRLRLTYPAGRGSAAFDLVTVNHDALHLRPVSEQPFRDPNGPERGRTTP